MAAPIRPEMGVVTNTKLAEMNKAAEGRIKWDKTAKCIPLVATINAIVNMHQKHVYLKALDAHDTNPKYLDNYHQRIINEPTWEQVALLVPILGQIVVGISSLVGKSKGPKKEQVTLENFDQNVKYYKLYPQTETRPKALENIKNRVLLTRGLLEEPATKLDGLKLLLEYATNGSPDAQLTLGIYYYRKSKSDQAETTDLGKAQFWLDQAKNNGIANAEEVLQDI